MEMSSSKMESAIQRQPSSSSSSSDSLPSTVDTNSTQTSFDCDAARLELLRCCLARRKKTQHPYSTLSEAYQRGTIRNLKSNDHGQVAGLWVVEVVVYYGEQVEPFSVEAMDTTKGGARKKAAEGLIEMIVNGSPFGNFDLDLLKKTTSCSDSVSSNEVTCPDGPPCNKATSHSNIDIPSPRSSQFTPKQARLLAEARIHHDQLDAMTLKRRLGAEEFVILAMDVEKNPRGSEILEVGLSYMLASDSWFIPAIHAFHLIISDHLHIHNDLPGYSQRDNFNFGTSEHVMLQELPHRIKVIIDAAAQAGPVFLMGHSVHNDIAWLANSGVLLDLPVCDLAKAYQSQKQSVQVTGLQKMMEALAVDHQNCHNGGNDAFYTLETGVEMINRLHPVVDGVESVSSLI